jgi:hypothetical protein
MSEMEPAIIVAIIALVASLLSATISLFGDVLLASRKARWEVKSAVAKYRGTLADAAYELQARLFNILKLDFLKSYYIDGEETEKEYAVQNTLYAVARYLAWVEALRHEVELGRFAEFQGPVARMTDRIARLFGSDDRELGGHFRIWRGEQQAIGDVMLKPRGGRPQCLSYAEFVEHRDGGFRKWFARLQNDIPSLAEDPRSERLRRLQNELVDLVRELDRIGRYAEAPMEKIPNLVE